MADGTNIDMVIDESAFEKASGDLSDLAQRVDRLRNEVEELLNGLRTGFDTPAGKAFLDSCEERLLIPLTEQKEAIAHITAALEASRGSYKKVFSEYQSFTDMVRSFGEDMK